LVYIDHPRALAPRPDPQVGDQDALGVEAHAGGFAVVGVVAVARELELEEVIAPEDILRRSRDGAQMEPGFAVVGV
jgi:hypothetical protein